MRLGVAIPTYNDFANSDVLRRLICEAEALNFDSVWFGDHIVVPDYAIRQTDYNWYEALSCAIFGMGLTTRISFGTDVLVAPYRNPVLLSKMVATASQLSGGRLALGLGVGYLKGEFEALGIPPFNRRGDVTDEYMRVMRLLLHSHGPLSYAGEWITFHDVHFGPVPTKVPPLLVGGNHGRAIERAARWGDGWHPLFISPEQYAEGRARIEEIRQREGLASRPFTYSYSCPQTRLLAYGEPPPAAYVQKLGAPADYDYVPNPGRTSDGRQRFIGTAAQLLDDVEAFAAAGADQIVLRFAMPNDPVELISAQWREFAHKFCP